MTFLLGILYKIIAEVCFPQKNTNCFFIAKIIHCLTLAFWTNWHQESVFLESSVKPKLGCRTGRQQRVFVCMLIRMACSAAMHIIYRLVDLFTTPALRHQRVNKLWCYLLSICHIMWTKHSE